MITILYYSGLEAATFVLMEPSFKPLSTSANLALISAETALSRSWKGARATGATKLPPLKEPSFAALIVSKTPGVMLFMAEESSTFWASGTVRTDQYPTNGVNRFVSSILPATAIKAPLPVLPPAPKITSPPLSIMEIVEVFPHSGSVKVLSNPTSL